MPDINYSKERKKLVEKRLDPARKRTWQENLLLKYKITPLVTFAPLEKKDRSDPDEPVQHGSTSFLGSGSYGKVFRAVYKGKEVAVKVTDDEAEVANWMIINSILETAPPDVVKHFPRIYAIIQDDEFTDQVLNIIVMELLKPLNSILKEKLFGGEGFVEGGGTRAEVPMSDRARVRMNKGKEESIMSLMKDEMVLFEAFKRAIMVAEKSAGIGISGPIRQELFKRILNFKPLGTGGEPVLDFTIYVTAQFAQIIEALRPEEKEPYTSLPNNITGLGYQIGDEIIKYLRDTAKAGNFPWTASISSSDRDVYKNIPEANSLLKALEYLESYGVSWHDVHSGNVMMRPSTGDPVIVDVGLYNQ
jgi:serine/threonine protein kinase